MLLNLLDHWRNGQHYGFPLCCRVQFMADRVLDAGMDLVIPEAAHETFNRLRLLTPRYSRADGLVPCTYHAARWVFTGQPAMPPHQRVRGKVCCEFRDQSEELLGVSLVPVVLDEFPANILWVLRRTPGSLTDMTEEDLHVLACPWCGSKL